MSAEITWKSLGLTKDASLSQRRLMGMVYVRTIQNKERHRKGTKKATNKYLKEKTEERNRVWRDLQALDQKVLRMGINYTLQDIGKQNPNYGKKEREAIEMLQLRYNYLKEFIKKTFTPWKA